MRNKEMCLVVDVETCGGFDSPKVYDLGIAVVVRATGQIVESHSLIIGEVFFGMTRAMNSAYYADKLPQYRHGIYTETFRVVNLWTAWRVVRDLIRKYRVKRVYAYNARFDCNALDYTIDKVSEGRYTHFFPRSVKVCCIWHMACQTILSQPTYRKFATANGMVSDKGNLRTSAECAYAYITGTPCYVEPHTGIEDVKIEVAILNKILRQKKRVRENVRRDCWRIPQRKVA